MPVYITSPSEVRDYFDHYAKNQSKLKTLIKGPHAFLEDNRSDEVSFYEEKGHFLIGGAADTIRTLGEEAFKEQYFVLDESKIKISPVMKWVIKRTFEKLKEKGENPESHHNADGRTDAWYKLVHEGLNCAPSEKDKEKFGYYMNRAKPTWEEDKRIDEVLEADKKAGYWDTLIQCGNKKILDYATKNIIDGIVLSWETNPAVNWFFKDEPDVDIYYQLVIFFEFLGIDCKALLDGVRVDHRAMTIQPADLKTMNGSTLYFSSSLKERRYDIQAASYTLAVRIWAQRMGLGHYTVLPFGFIVESNTMPGNPLYYEADDTLLNVGMIGLPARVVEAWPIPIVYPEVIGYEECVKRYIWYSENGFDKHRDYVISNGKFKLGWNGPYITEA